MAGSRKLICGGIVSVILVIFIAIAHFAWPKPNGLLCMPTKEIPTISSPKLITPGGSVSAKLAGYLELLDTSETVYLPLDFHTVSEIKQHTGPDVIEIRSNCVVLEIRYVKRDAEIKYTSLDMLIKDGRKPNKVARKVCVFSNPFNFSHSINENYSCKQTRNHLCVIDRPSQKANLVLTTFEFEINGDLDSASAGSFAKKPFGQSCDRWSSFE
jgi:hypothetical protein